MAATGAYCYSMASSYNRLPRPAVVAVRDGAARVMLRRETPEDQFRLEVGVMGEPCPGTPMRCARLLGCGTVGERGRAAAARAGRRAGRAGRRPVELVGVAVRRPHRHPELGELLTTDAAALVTRDDVDVVVEVIGGIEPARTLLLEALKAGKSVVTANKALLAEDGADAGRGGRRVRARTSTTRPRWPGRSRCCGRCASRWPATGSPAWPASSTAPRTSSCPRWRPRASSYADALEEATRLGYAEADPSADVDGYDAASKAAILASLAFHTRVTGRGRVLRGHPAGHAPPTSPPRRASAA